MDQKLDENITSQGDSTEATQSQKSKYFDFLVKRAFGYKGSIFDSFENGVWRYDVRIIDQRTGEFVRQNDFCSSAEVTRHEAYVTARYFAEQNTKRNGSFDEHLKHGNPITDSVR